MTLYNFIKVLYIRHLNVRLGEGFNRGECWLFGDFYFCMGVCVCARFFFLMFTLKIPPLTKDLIILLGLYIP